MHGRTSDPWASLRGNALLQALSAGDAMLLAPHLQRRRYGAGEACAQLGAPVTEVVFPETAVIALSSHDGKAGAIRVGLVGAEGMIGWPALLGAPVAVHGGTAQLAGGTALTIPTDRLLAASARSATLSRSLLGFVQSFLEQVTATMVSNLCDAAERRVSRWLLMLHDRIDGDELIITHDALASLVNLRRASVTDALHVLEGDHVLRCVRGRVTVRDREALRAAAGEAPVAANKRFGDGAAVGLVGEATA